MDKRTQAEKDRAKRQAAAIRRAARTPEQKMEQRFDVEDRFGGTTLEGKPVTDAIFDDPRVAGPHAEMLAARGQDPYDPEVAPEPEPEPKKALKDPTLKEPKPWSWRDQ